MRSALILVDYVLMDFILIVTISANKVQVVFPTVESIRMPEHACSAKGTSTYLTIDV